MKRLLSYLLVGVLVATAVSAVSENASLPKVREPAVAGLFYPRDAAVLGSEVDRYLAAATTERVGKLKALICPHAGYRYSGPVAAAGFRLLRGLHFQTVMLLGPAHYAMLDAASISDAQVFRTPLGDVPISPRARQLARWSPFALDPPCLAERPEWAEQSSRPPLKLGTDRADTWEHSDEVEVPFLQRTLGAFELIPVVMGNVDPARAARTLAAYVDASTLLVVSSDLSHYYPYAEAQKLDRHCVEAICGLDVKAMEHEQACGRIPILTLMYLARERGWRPQLLDLRNSGDTSGDKSRVVGYAAIAFYAPSEQKSLTAEDRHFLLQLARQAIRTSVTSGNLPPLATERLSEALKSPKGVFVTLTEHGQLRGCIGHIVAQMPLYRAVAENARSAALHDPRFRPVASSEVDALHIEISVLSTPKPLAFTSPAELLQKLRSKEDGVVLRIAAGTATYLPQVWEQVPEKEAFLDSLAEKAGGRAGDWRKPGTAVAIYHVESFEEEAN